MWLMSDILDDHWYPRKSKIIAVSSLTGNGETSLVFHVHDKYPLRWREEPYYPDIKRLATYGLHANTWVTEVVVGDQLWIILPNKDILVTSQSFRIVDMGGNEWDVIQGDINETESRKLRLAGLRAA